MPHGRGPDECLFVLDTTALIHIHRNSAQEVVRRLGFPFVAPRSVANEFSRGLRNHESFSRRFPWLKVVADSNSSQALAEGLGPGEQMAIRHCMSDCDGSILISDDKLARTVALREHVCTVDSRSLFSMVYARGLTRRTQYVSHLRSVLGFPKRHPSGKQLRKR